MTCASCGAENRAEARFCESCGSPLARTCPNGHPVSASARFCDQCGAAVAGRRRRQPAAARRSRRARRRAPARVRALRRPGRLHRRVSEGRDAEDTRELLSRYFDLARTTIDRYGGTVEKFIGDAVMAVWGAPVANEDDAERAVRAALDLVAAVPDLDPSLQARAGVLTGEAAVTVGAEGQGMVAGDLVEHRLAHPVRGRARGTVLVGEATKRAHRGRDRLRATPAARAQGQGGAGSSSGGPLQVRAPAARAGPRHGRRSAVRRPSGGAAPGQGALPLERRRAAGAPRLGRRRRRDRQVAPVLGVREVPRRAGRGRLVASRTLPLVRRRRRLLGARGDGARAGQDPRGRGRRDAPRRSSARCSSCTWPTPRSGVDRAPAHASARPRGAIGAGPRGPVLRVAALLRAPGRAGPARAGRSRTSTGPTRGS